MRWEENIRELKSHRRKLEYTGIGLGAEALVGLDRYRSNAERVCQPLCIEKLVLHTIGGCDEHTRKTSITSMKLTTYIHTIPSPSGPSDWAGAKICRVSCRYPKRSDKSLGIYGRHLGFQDVCRVGISLFFGLGKVDQVQLAILRC